MLIVSLDFELFWGMQDVCSLNDYKHNLMGVWDAVPELLDIFQQNDVHATWATVGFMFADSLMTLKNYIPPKELLPTYDEIRRSAYRCIESENIDSQRKCFFAPELISKISRNQRWNSGRK